MADIFISSLTGPNTLLAQIDGLTCPAVSGDTVWVKADGVYIEDTIYAERVFTNEKLPIKVVGYTTTPGDGGKATIQYSGSGDGVNLLRYGGFGWIFENLIFDANNDATYAFATDSTGCGECTIERCEANNATRTGWFFNGTGGSSSSGYGYLGYDLSATGNGSQPTPSELVDEDAGFVVECEAVSLYRCKSFLNNGNGFYLACSSLRKTLAQLDRCQAYQNTGNAYHIFSQANLINCNGYGNGLNGVVEQSGEWLLCSIFNSIFANNGHYGIRTYPPVVFTDTVWAKARFKNNAYYNNTLGQYSGIPPGENDVTLTGDPFVDGPGGDFTLNSTAGAGLAAQGTAI